MDKPCPKCGTIMTSLALCMRCDNAGLPARQSEIKIEVDARDIIAKAEEAIGWPFRHQGRTKEGIDCIGLIFHVGIGTGLVQNLNLPEYYNNLGYSRLPSFEGPDAHWLLEELRATFQQVRRPKMGDIVYCRDKKWVHVGFVTPQDMIHAYAANIRRVVKHPYDRQWKDRTVGIFRFPGVTY